MFHVYVQSVGKCSFRFSQEHTPLLVKFLSGTATTVSDGERFLGHFTFRLSAASSGSRAAALSIHPSPPPSCDAPAQWWPSSCAVPLPLAAVAVAKPPSQASNSPIEIHHGGCAAPASTPQPSYKRGRETCFVNHSPRTLSRCPHPRQTLSNCPRPRQTPPSPFG